MNHFSLPTDGLGHSYRAAQPELSRWAAERHALLAGRAQRRASERARRPGRARSLGRALRPLRRALARGLHSTARRLEPGLDPR